MTPLGHQRVPRQPVRVQPRQPVQFAGTSSRRRERRAEAATSSAATLEDRSRESDVLLRRRIRARTTRQMPFNLDGVRADRRHAARRLHRVRVAGLQRRAHRRAAARPSSTTRCPVAALDPVTLRYLEFIPVSTDPCGRYQHGYPTPRADRRSSGASTSSRARGTRSTPATWTSITSCRTTSTG